MRSTKTLWKVFLAGIGAVGLAMSSWASVGVTACSTTNAVSGQSDIQVAAQLVTAATGPTILLSDAANWPGNGAGSNRNLLYAPNIDVTTDSTIRFDFTNFGVKSTASNRYYLRLAGAGTDESPVNRQMGTLVDFTSFTYGGTVYYTSMTFKIVDHDVNGDGFDLGTDDRILANQTVVISETSASYTAPTIKINGGLSSGAIGTMSAPVVKDATGVAKEAPSAPSLVKVFTLVNGLSAHVYNPVGPTVGYATSTIDVDPANPSDARKVFVVEAGGDTPTDKTSLAQIKVTNNAEYGFHLDGNDLWTLSIKRSNKDGVSSVSIGGLGMGAPALVNGYYVYTKNSDFGEGGLDLTTAQDLLITVNGTTVVQNGTWTVDLTVDTDDVGLPGDTGNIGTPDQTLLTTATSHVWDTNGAQFAVPYFNTKTTAYGTSLVITNKFTSSAAIAMDIWTDLGLVATNVSLGSLAPSTTTFLDADTIQAAATAAIPSLVTNPNGSGKRWMAIFTVNAPADQILTTAFQNDATGAKRTMNVMTKGTAFDTKSWKW